MKPSTIEFWKWNIQQAISFAHSQPLEEIELQEVADRLHVSKDNFSHMFKKIRKEAYQQFVKRSRLEAGVGYLRHSGYSISQISEMCRYTHAAFTKAIRSRFNCSPTHMRDVDFLPEEANTLQQTELVTHSKDYADIFNLDKTEDVRLPSMTLYYHILPGHNNPVKSMMAYMDIYTKQLQYIIRTLGLHDARIITGSLDVVPITTYTKMMMYVGLLLPNTLEYNTAHFQIIQTYRESFRLVHMQMAGGDFKKLTVPMSFAEAGLPMYKFINNNCRESNFKMSNNYFFISLPAPDKSEIYIPWQKTP
ncbi:helix-turn-helix transcriptional regulator [Chitinophaga solisilvae]|uniref:Helix-turn-helix transcriptional regulator n=1 Tax=Chitinophaga solisilvae TaxID=1233460 RepID=A0A3S1D2J7_9BACT|nr:AraC family transcriptional regulator [Chitinophaga solisilvae]NSL89925.1 helix-turn-helix transcriptional regulator [Chitinophaga solisilvae]